MYNHLQELGDSYKYCHHNLYPKGTLGTHFYFEARNNKLYDKVVFFGMQYLIRQYLNDSVWSDSTAHMAELAQAHGLPFNAAGWNYLEELGYYPIRIIGKPEGSICDIREPLFTVESTDPRCVWLPGFLETLLVKLWYPCTIATKAYYMHNLLKAHAMECLDATQQSWADFAYHNFGDRGSSSVEAAALGGMAHMIFFKGTDNMNAVSWAYQHYPEYNKDKPLRKGRFDLPEEPDRFPVLRLAHAYSIPATEHSVMTSYGKRGEDDAILNFVTTYAPTHKIIACVLDSYDITRAVDYVTRVGSPVRACLETSKTTLVIRPDSGDPIQVLEGIFKILGNNGVAYHANSKGLRVFDNYKIIWGDGITPQVIDTIVRQVVDWGFSPEVMAFGSGGDLMQNCNRDTLGFAYKLSSITLDCGHLGVNDVPVCKDPITDPGKKSKAGLQKIKDGVVYYEDGKGKYKDDPYSFAQVRRNAGM